MNAYRFTNEHGHSGICTERERFGGIERFYYYDHMTDRLTGQPMSSLVAHLVPRDFGMVVFHVNGVREVVK